MRTHPYLDGRRSSQTTRLHSSWTSHLQGHWGRRTWDALFLLAADFPHERDCIEDKPFVMRELHERRKGWKQLLTSLPNVITCPVCAEHFENYMIRYPVTNALRNRDTLFKWLYRAKDEVNQRTHRTSPSLDRVKKKYIAPCISSGRSTSPKRRRSRKRR